MKLHIINVCRSQRSKKKDTRVTLTLTLITWKKTKKKTRTDHHQTLTGKIDLRLCVRKPTIWVPTRSDTNIEDG